MKRLFILSIVMLALSTISFTQNGQYDVRLDMDDCNCCTSQLFVDIHIRASSVNSTFRIADQTYIFSFNPNAIESVQMVNEGEISGFIVPGDGGDLGFSLYGGHNLTVTSNEVAYNVDFSGGDGLLIETEWVYVGTIVFNILDIVAPLELNWLTQSDTPPTFIGEVAETGDGMAAEGMYINSIPLNSFSNCDCPLGYSATILGSQEDVDNFAIDYPISQVANLVIQSNDDLIDNLAPLSDINSLERLIITNNNALSSLAGLENITSIGCELTIINNPQLTICNIPAICNYLENGGASTISNNGGACNDDTEVLQSCFLPVEMSTPLQARLQNQTAILTWRTETETNNAGFEIQKSKDGNEWERIDWQAGEGNTYTPHAYTYVDENPFSNTSYYRLKQVDFDGNFTYSNIASLEYNRPHVNIFPNPVKDKLYLNTNEQTIDDVLIFDTMGRQINAQLTDNTLDVSSLSEGLYTIKVIIGGQYFYEKIVVE